MDKFEWLSRLVSFDTTSRNSNLDLIASITDWFKQHNIPCRLTYDAKKQKANLFASIISKVKEGGLILSGHVDVVPVDGQIWQTNPFNATRLNNKIFGRGTSDMKGFVAVVLSLVPFFQQMKLSMPIHIALTYDEEVGCHGARKLILDFKNAGFKPDACIVGEPSNMQVVVAHKGIQVFRCRVKGRAAHSSLTPQGCNAIEYAAMVIQKIRDLSMQLRQEPLDHYFDVPFTTISTDVMQGGTANNIIPENCEFVFEFRHLPNVDPDQISTKIKTVVKEEILPQMKKEFAAAEIEIEQIGVVPSFSSDEKAKIYKLAQASNDAEIHKVAYATEAGLFQSAGIPTIICGPGSIEQAHRPNEFITVDQLEACELFLKKVVKEFCGDTST